MGAARDDVDRWLSRHWDLPRVPAYVPEPERERVFVSALLTPSDRSRFQNALERGLHFRVYVQ